MVASVVIGNKGIKPTEAIDYANTLLDALDHHQEEDRQKRAQEQERKEAAEEALEKQVKIEAQALEAKYQFNARIQELGDQLRKLSDLDMELRKKKIDTAVLTKQRDLLEQMRTAIQEERSAKQDEIRAQLKAKAAALEVP